MKPEGFFVTGTDTGIGKTYISKLLADALSTVRDVTYMKPVQTGCYVDSRGNLVAPDLEFVTSGKAKITGPYEVHVPYRFLPACSPHLAAFMSSDVISPGKIFDCYKKLSQSGNFVIVEGAGGLMAPLGQTVYMIDLISCLRLPVILVTSPRLGTLNHTFLSIKALRQSGAEIAAVVLNNRENEPESFIYQDNREVIRRYINPVELLEVKYGSTQSDELLRFCSSIGI